MRKSRKKQNLSKIRKLAIRHRWGQPSIEVQLSTTPKVDAPQENDLTSSSACTFPTETIDSSKPSSSSSCSTPRFGREKKSIHSLLPESKEQSLDILIAVIHMLPEKVNKDLSDHGIEICKNEFKRRKRPTFSTMPKSTKHYIKDQILELTNKMPEAIKALAIASAMIYVIIKLLFPFSNLQ